MKTFLFIALFAGLSHAIRFKNPDVFDDEEMTQTLTSVVGAGEASNILNRDTNLA